MLERKIYKKLENLIKEDLLKKEIVGKTTYYLTNNDLVSLK